MFSVRLNAPVPSRLTAVLRLLVTLFVIGSLCVIGQAADQSDDAARERLREALEDVLPEAALAVVMVKRDGQTLLGHANGQYDGAACHGLLPAASLEVTLNHRFDVGSVAKMFTAVAILRLQMQGKLDVHDPVAEYVGEIIGLVGDHRSITIHHLITHTSGLPNDLSFRSVNLHDRDAVLRTALTATLQHKSGEVHEYNNIGYFVLAGLVEIVSGESFEAFVAREVFEPAGMVDTGFLQPIDTDWHFETPRVRAADGACIGTASYYAWSWGFRGATGVVSTAGDLARWHDALQDDTLLSHELRELYFTPAKAKYACGWFVDVDAEGRAVQHHGGGTPGFRAMLTRYPDEDAVVITLCDEQCNPSAVDAAMRSALFAGEDAGGPSIEATMHIGLRRDQIDEHGVLKLLEQVSLHVVHEANEKGDAAAGVSLEIRQAGDVIGRVDMQPGVARGLLRDLAAVLDAKPAAQPDDPQTAEASLATLVYSPDDAGDIQLRAPLRWMVMPRYVGVDAQGERFVDERTTVVLVDEARQFWPIILRLDRTKADALARDLESAMP